MLRWVSFRLVAGLRGISPFVLCHSLFRIFTKIAANGGIFVKSAIAQPHLDLIAAQFQMKKSHGGSWNLPRVVLSLSQTQLLSRHSSSITYLIRRPIFCLW